MTTTPSVIEALSLCRIAAEEISQMMSVEMNDLYNDEGNTLLLAGCNHNI